MYPLFLQIFYQLSAVLPSGSDGFFYELFYLCKKLTLFIKGIVKITFIVFVLTKIHTIQECLSKCLRRTNCIFEKTYRLYIKKYV